MKHLGKFAILGAFLAASTSFAFATPITYQLGSYAGTAPAGDTNSAMQWVGVEYTTGTPTGLSTTPVTPISSTPAVTLGTDSGVWYGPLSNSTWVGINANVGPGGSENPPYGYYDFQTTFDATAGTYDGTLNVLADDTVEVVLNGDYTDPLVVFGALGSDTHCATDPTGCELSTETSAVLTDLNLLSGQNTLDFIVEQAGIQTSPAGQDPSGVDFNADLTQTPEPGTLFLLGTGLLGAAGIARRKFAAKFV